MMVAGRQVPETLGRSHPSANWDTNWTRKIEYKNLVQESEAAQANSTRWRPESWLLCLKTSFFLLGKPPSRESCSHAVRPFGWVVCFLLF